MVIYRIETLTRKHRLASLNILVGAPVDSHELSSILGIPAPREVARIVLVAMWIVSYYSKRPRNHISSFIVAKLPELSLILVGATSCNQRSQSEQSIA